jgi:hypothetical protein
MTDGEWTNQFLPVAPHLEKSRSFGGAKPLMTVTRIISGAQFLQIQGHHSGRVRPIDERVNTAVSQFLYQLVDGENHSGLACDMIQNHQPRPASHLAQHRFDDLIGCSEGKRNVGDDEAGARPIGHEAHGVAAGIVLVVGDQKLVAAPELERTQNGVDPASRVWDEHQLIGSGSQELSQGFSGLIEQTLQRGDEKLDRLPLDSFADLPLGLKDRARATAEGTVVEKDNLRIERPDPWVGGWAVSEGL